MHEGVNTLLAFQETMREDRDTNQTMSLSSHNHHPAFTHNPCASTSPFIRPDDQDSYASSADVIKVCGRNMGSEFLIRTVSAYLEKSFHGNLLALLDATDWMTEHYHLPNDLFPDTFLETITTCSKNCTACRSCHDLFATISRSTLGTIDPLS